MVELLEAMARRGASDLFLVTGAPLQVKIDGRVHPVSGPPLTAEAVRGLLYGVMTERQQRELEAEWECNFALSVPDLGRFRFNVYFQRGQLAAVVRFLKSRIPTLEELHLPARLKELVLEPRGLFLVVGATGSGKSTTLAAMIQHRAQTCTGHILTIEDPIEYLHAHGRSVISQREVGIDTKSYAAALKNAMREAPDVIMIGEVRDAETMRAAIAYADTGHLCLSTLHANNAYQALERIVNFFPEEARAAVLEDLALNLCGIFSQRLMQGLDGGRLPACELLLPTPYVVDLIRKGELEAVRDAMAHGRDAGMITFEDSVFAAWQAGRVSREEALRHVDSRANLLTRMRLSRGPASEGGFELDPGG
ncbi:MAG: twitching motility protein PilT [Porticoccaceae bacterium]|nr:MAG: twitching motility protein PilT [Porticoccaceae bacterium]